MYDSEDVAAVDASDQIARGRARWTLVMTLGDLTDPEAGKALERIAETPLPNPAESDAVFASEYRIRLRAIDGLRKAGAMAVLERIHRRGGLLSGAAGTALTDLGRAPKGFQQVEPTARTAFVDPRDFNPKPEPRPEAKLPPLTEQAK
jgi:hypothetical protein